MRYLGGSHAVFKNRMRFFRTWIISRMRKKFTACDKKLFFAYGKTRSHANQKSRKIACGKNPIRAENGKTHENEKNGKKRENRMRKKPLRMRKKYQKHMCYKRVRPRHENPHVNNSNPHVTFKNRMWKKKPACKYKIVACGF